MVKRGRTALWGIILLLVASADAQVVSNRVTIIPTADGTAVGELRFRERQVNGVNYLGLKAPDSISTNGFCRFPLNCDGLGQVLAIVGSGTSNGNILLQPGNVAANASVFIETPRLDVAGLIIRDPSGTTTGNSFEIRKNDNTVAFKVIGATDAGAPGTVVTRDLVPFDDVTWKLGNNTHRWNQYWGNDIDVTGLSYFHRNSSGNSVVRVENSNVAGFSSVEFLDSSSNSKGLIGFANGSAVVAPSSFLVGTNGANEVSFYVNGTVRYRLTTSGGMLGNLTSTDVSYNPGAIISSDAFVSATASTNASVGSLAAVAGVGVAVSSSRTGSGTFLPLQFYTSASKRWEFDTSGNFLPAANTTYNIGTTSLRPNVIYVSTLDVSGGITTPSGAFSGLIGVRNSAGTASCTISVNFGVIYSTTC